MKTEPTEALKIIDFWGFYHSVDEEEYIDIDNSTKAVNLAFKEGQSNPKIKELEWEEVYKSIFNVDTSFKYTYEIHVNDDGSTILFDSSGRKPKRFINLKEAKSAAQEDFENRVKQCLEL